MEISKAKIAAFLKGYYSELSQIAFNDRYM